MEQQQSKKIKQPQGGNVPKYMATFADLMTLILCFFVLILSMAELEYLHYKVVVESMRNAFGVKTEQEPEPIPKAESVIKQSLTPGDNQEEPIFTEDPIAAKQNESDAVEINDVKDYLKAKINRQKKELDQLLETEISQDMLTIETVDDRIIIRINEQASFPSGSAKLKSAFIPVLHKISEALAKTDNQFVVSGHTDNIPIRSRLYRSNWELSAARATSVVHELLYNRQLKPERFRIEGYAETRPLVDNSTPANRAINRRVEIGVVNY